MKKNKREAKFMTFSDWLFSTAENPRFENPGVNGRWGLFHILTMLACVAAIIGFWLIVKKSKNKDKARKTIIIVLVSLILFFEVMMRIVHFVGFSSELSFWRALWILIPRPWCAISCWTIMISVLVNKKFFYNFASISALLCSAIFFVCPGVGFNNKIILFQNLYSIATHALLLVTSITMIVLKFTDFKYKGIWKEIVCFAAIFVYSFIIIFALKLESDPMYFMPNGDIQAGIFGIPYGLYMVVYVAFMLLYFNTFYLIGDRKNIREKFKKNKKISEKS